MKKPIVTTLLLLGAFSLFSQRAKFVSVNAQKMTGRAQTASVEELLNLEGGLTLEVNNSPAQPLLVFFTNKRALEEDRYNLK